MSNVIDERVVSMQFDNRSFESNVQTSLGTIAKLKQSLNFTGATKGMQDLGAAAKKVDMTPLGNAVHTVGLKFNGMYVMADQYLRNLEYRVEQAARNIVRSFTIDPIKTGLSEYETQINAVQTILANTQSKGTTLDDVNGALDELNAYADKTIYNFTEMTRNIGTFTAAGTDLDTSVNAIQGIANLAAISGSTSQQASTAMYQLSQALASGTVKLMDWNSVVNAGMGGQVFQDALKETARVHGVAIDDMVKKNGSFRETLQEGWLTSEILTETLQKFTLTTEGLTEAQIEQNRQMLKNKGYSDEQIDEIFKLGETATNAATKVKTFTQLMDTLKEAAQSGWTQTWEILIGDFEEAKELWTGVSDVFSKIIGDSADARNKMLEGAMTSGWDKFTKGLEKENVSVTELEDSLRKVAEAHDLDLDKIIEESGSLEKAFQNGKISADLLKESLDGIQEAGVDLDFSNISRNLKSGMKGDDVRQIEQALKSLGYNLTGKDGKDYSDDGFLGSLTVDAIKEFQKAQGLKVTGIVDESTLTALEKATSKTKKLSDSIYGLVDGVTELGGRELVIESLKNVFNGLLSILKPIKNAFKQVFPPITSEQLYGFLEGIRDLTAKFKLSRVQTKHLHDAFRGFFSVIKIGWNFVKSFASGIVKLLGSFSGLGDLVLNAAGALGRWFTGLEKTTSETDIFGTIINKVVGFLQTLIEKVKSAWKFLTGKFKSPGFEGFLSLMKGIWDIISKIAKKIGEVGSSIVKSLSGVFSSDNIGTGFDIVNGALFTGILLGIKKFINQFTDMTDLKGSATGFFKSASEALGSVKDSLQAWQTDLKAGTLLKIAVAIGILAAAIVVIATIDSGKLAGSLTAIGVLFGELLIAMKVFDSIGGSFKGAFKAAVVMIGMSTAILILAGAVKTMSSLSWEELAKGLVGVGLLMAEIAIFMNTAKFSGKTFTTAAGIVVLAAALKILASACSDFGAMKWSEIGKGLASIGALLLMIATFTKLTGNSKRMISTGIGLTLLGASMKIFASSVKDFSGMNWNELARGLVGLGGSLLVVAAAMRIMPRNAIGIGTGLLVMSAALLVIAEALTKMGGMTWEELGKGLLMLAGSILILALGLNAMNGTAGGSFSLLIAVGALALLTPVLKALGNMKWSSIAKGLVAMAGAFAIMGVAGMLLTPLAPTLLAVSGAMALMGASVLLLGLGITAVAAGLGAFATMTATGATAIVASLTIIVSGIAALIPTILREFGNGIVEFCKVIGNSATAIGEAIKAVVLALVDVIVECAPAIANGALKLLVEILNALVTYTPQIVASLADFLIGLINGLAEKMPELIEAGVNLLMAFFTGITDAFMALDTGALMKGVVGAGILAVLVMAFSALAGFIPGAIIGVLGLGAFIVALGAVVAAVGALAQIPGLDYLVGEGADMMMNLGNAIGGFVGGIIGGIGEGISASLPDIGTNLSTFMTNISPFLEGAKTIDESTLTGVGNLVGIVAAITAASLLEGITSWITGESSMETFSTEIGALGTGLKNFADNTSGIDTESASAAVDVAIALSTFANSLPTTGGLFSVFTGDQSMATFSTEIGDLGTGLKTFADNVSGIDSESVTSAVSVATSLSDFANSLPTTGGLFSLFTGDQSMTTFATEIGSLGTGLKTFADNVSGIDSESVVTAVAVATSLSTFASSLPETGGLFSLFTGDQDMATFATDIGSLGEGLATFASKVSGIDADTSTSISSAIDAATKLSDFANALPTTGGLFAMFAGDNDMKTFGEDLVSFGGDLAEFGTEVSSIDEKTAASITAATNAAVALSTFANSLPETGGLFSVFTGDNGMDTFGTNLISFGVSLKDFSDELDGINSDSITTGLDTANTLSTFATGIPEGGYDILKTFGGQMKTFGENIGTFYSKIKNIDTKQLASVVVSFSTLVTTLKGIVDSDFSGLGDFGESLGTLGKDGVDALVKSFKDSGPKIKTAGADMIAKVIDGAKFKKPVLTRTIKSVASACVDAIEDKYKDFKDAGKYVVSGFSAGITANTFKAKASASAMASAALAAARLALLVNSPSRAFYEVGDFAGQGFVNALDDYGSISYKAGRSMADNARRGLTDAISKVSDMISNGIDSQPTIRPVLDLSDVTSGMNTMDGLFSMGPSLDVLANVGSISSMMSRGQNGSNEDVVSAINDLRKSLNGRTGDTFNFGNIAYDDDSTMHNAVRDLVKAAKLERRR